MGTMAELEQNRAGIFMDILRSTLRDIMKHDKDYKVRYGLVLRAMNYAHELGFKAGVRIDEYAIEWPVFYIELPTGQISWHMPQHPEPWDQHSTDEKFRRITEFLKS